MLTWRGLICALCMVLAVCSTQAQPVAPAVGSLDQDRTTLSNFLEGIDNALNTTLGSWDATSSQDICTWPGVICNCSQLAAPYTDGCLNITAGVAGPRVIGLDLAGEGPYAAQPLQGTITDSIGDLTALVYLDFGQNNLRGTLPGSLSSIRTLRWLLLGSNQLTGNLPDPLGQLPGMLMAALDDNNFTGPIPDSWCGSTAQFRVEGNPLLCGVVPCPNKFRSLDGTYLFRRGQTGVGGGCSTTAPYCNLNVGCRVMAPRFWTSRTAITFNFTEAFDPVTGPVRYQWCLGTSPGTDDALPLRDVVARFNTTNVNTPWGSELVRMSPVVFNMSSVSLTEGGSYYPTVLAWNNAGPPLYTAYTAQSSVAVDTTGPTGGQVFNTMNYTQSIFTTTNRVLEASWSGFTDAQSGINGYMVQFFQQAANRSLPSFNVTPAMDAGLLTQVSVAVNTTAGRAYFARVTAMNGAGLRSSVNGIPIRVRINKGVYISAGLTALAAVLTGVGCLVIGGVAAYMWLVRKKLRDAKKREMLDQESHQMRQLMSALKDNANAMGPSGAGRQSSMTVHQKVASGPEETSGGWALVITDVESSSDISKKDPVAFGKIQAAHDMVMREGLSKYDGYEIITEGDSFHIAFTNVYSAVGFCLDVQSRLMDINWDTRILKLDECKMVTDDDGQLMFIGPRVRMGVHWAEAGIVVKDHEHTKHKHFEGPSYETAVAIGDTASGGQIVMTRDALLELVNDMGRAHFPVIQCLGLYHINTFDVWLYEVKEHVSRPMHRVFPELRKCEHVWPGTGRRMPPNTAFTITPCPVPEDDTGTLTFVSSMYMLPGGQTLSAQLPESLYKHLLMSFASQAQQFRGYMFNWNTLHAKEGIFMLAFPTTADAVKFCHAIQVHLMYAKYPAEAAPYISPPATGPDGKWVFHGPRLGLAVHRGNKYTVTCSEEEGPRCPVSLVTYRGDTLSKTQLLCKITRGGQVVLSDESWQAVKADIAAHCTSHMVIHLGKHQLCDTWDEPQHLYEVMPTMLAERKFGKPRTMRRVEMGYREAPEAGTPMVVVFVKVDKPKAVEAARSVKEQVELRDRHLMTAWMESVAIHNWLLRALLKAHGGYECKEPEPGKFTLAFHDLWSAIRWATQFQQDLLSANWPPALLELEECREQEDAAGQLIWRGLRTRVGMSWGRATTKKPLNTGHADYFGVLPNRAARVMGGAHPGQVLGEFTAEEEAPSVLKELNYDVSIMAKYRDPMTGELLQPRPPGGIPDDFIRLGETRAGSSKPGASAVLGEVGAGVQNQPVAPAAVEEIYIKGIGEWSLKGLDGNYIYECIAPKLRNRVFGDPLFTQRVTDGKYKDKGTGKATPSAGSVTYKGRAMASGVSVSHKSKAEPGTTGAAVVPSSRSAVGRSIASFASFTAAATGRKSPPGNKQKGLDRPSHVRQFFQGQDSQASSNQAASGHGGSTPKEDGSEPGTPHSGQIAASYGMPDGSPRGKHMAATQRAHSASLDSHGRQGSPSPQLYGGPQRRPYSYMGPQAPGPELGLPVVRTQHLQPAGSIDTTSWGGSSIPSAESTPRDMNPAAEGGLSPRATPVPEVAGPQRSGLWSRLFGILPGRTSRAASYTPDEASSRDSTPRQAAQLSDGSNPEAVPHSAGSGCTAAYLPPPAQQLMQQQQAGSTDVHLSLATGAGVAAVQPSGAAEGAAMGSPTSRPPCSSPGAKRSFSRCASPLAPAPGTVRTASNSSLLAQASNPSRLGLLAGMQETGSFTGAPTSSSCAADSSAAAVTAGPPAATRPGSASLQAMDPGAGAGVPSGRSSVQRMLPNLSGEAAGPTLDSCASGVSRPPSATSPAPLRAAAAMEEMTPEGSEAGLEGAVSPSHSNQSAVQGAADGHAAAAPASGAGIEDAGASSQAAPHVKHQWRAPHQPIADHQQPQQAHDHNSSAKAALSSGSHSQKGFLVAVSSGFSFKGRSSGGGGSKDLSAASTVSSASSAPDGEPPPEEPQQQEQEWTAQQYREFALNFALARKSGFGTVHKVVAKADMTKWAPHLPDKIVAEASAVGGGTLAAAAKPEQVAVITVATGPSGNLRKVHTPVQPQAPLKLTTIESSNSSSSSFPTRPCHLPASPTAAVAPQLPAAAGLVRSEGGGCATAKAAAQLSGRSSSRLSQASSGHSSPASTPRSVPEPCGVAAQPLAAAAAALMESSREAPGSPGGLRSSAGGASSNPVAPSLYASLQHLPPPLQARDMPGPAQEGGQPDAQLKVRARAAAAPAAPSDSSTTSSTPGQSPSTAGSQAPGMGGQETPGGTAAHAAGSPGGSHGSGWSQELEAGAVSVPPAAVQSPGRRRGIPCDRVGSNRALQGIPEGAGHEEVSPRSSQH